MDAHGDATIDPGWVWGTEGWCDTQPFSRNPARQFPATPILNNHIEIKWETSHFKVCEWLSLCSGGGAGCFDFEIIGNSDNTTIFTHATAKNQRDFALRVHPQSGSAKCHQLTLREHIGPCNVDDASGTLHLKNPP